MILAYTPAKTSSNMIPHPPGSFSILLIMSGLAISKNLNKTNPANKYFTVTGKNNRLMHMPAISSITTRCGSLPHVFSTTAELHIPTKVITRVIAKAAMFCGPFNCKKYQQMQHATAATVPAPLPI